MCTGTITHWVESDNLAIEHIRPNMQPIDITGTAGPLSPKSIKSSPSDDDRSYDTIMTDGDRAVTPIKSETEEGVRKVNRLGRACGKLMDPKQRSLSIARYLGGRPEMRGRTH